MGTTLRLVTIALVIGLSRPALAQQEEGSSSLSVSPAAHTPRRIEPPQAYRDALRRGTRTAAGAPGPRYWQQWAEYDLEARIDTEAKRLDGRARILYHNRSPGALDSVFLFLNQNLHAPGAIRSRPQEVTGGVELSRVAFEGVELQRGTGYEVDGTVLTVTPPAPLPSGARAALELDWAFTIPQAGASGRMGWSEDNLLFLAYWYPQLAVYNDVVGWQSDPFTGTAEFYAGFAHYQLAIDVPEGWVVLSTGTLQNPGQVLSEEVMDRLERAARSDTVIHVIDAALLRQGPTRSSRDGRLTWRFVADSVRDIAFAVTRESLWDAARAAVGDRDGDGTTDYARVDALYRPDAFRWVESVRYAQHALSFLSRFTGVAYPWPHMTAVEGGGIMSGGMEFPMMTLIGTYDERSDTALYRVTAHELAHMWVPMTVNTDERRYSWMDEGTTRFNGHEAARDFYSGTDPSASAFESYLQAARAEDEGPILTWSDHHRTYQQYRMASYSKPEVLLYTLRSLLGHETFARAYRSYLRDWSFKHPYPWDFFHSFETAAGRDLDWFWRSFYYETWVLDQAIAAVQAREDGTRIVVRNVGTATLPVRLAVRRSDRTELRLEIPVEVWLAGAEEAAVTVPAGPAVTRVEIDPEAAFPDIDRSNNVWGR